MTEKLEKQAKVDAQPTYDPPQALRLGGLHTGEGGITPTCTVPGSGAVGDCGTGASATGWCYVAGNTADFGCDASGNTASTSCYGDGGSAITECNTTGSGF